MKYTFIILLLVIGFASTAETRDLPDLRGTYGLDTKDDIKLFIVNSNTQFQLMDNQENPLTITIKHVDERIDVAGIVTYFISVLNNGQKDYLELVHNRKANYIMMELESNRSLRWKSVGESISMVGASSR
jgi:hypothetical protein